MCAPAAAALLLAALSALPCRGTDADIASRIPNKTNNQQTASQPTVNKLYQMLHTAELNRSIDNFNYSSGIAHMDVFNNINIDDENSVECCDKLVEIKSNVSLDIGATVIDSKRDRRRRVVNVRAEIETTTSSSKVIEVTSMPLVPSLSPVVMEKRRKPGETGSSAPLLNYIFDAYSNTHQHHNKNEKVEKGNSIYAAAAPEVEALVGSTAHLDCKVDALHDKLVSWVRRKNDETPMELLTTGTQQYTADDRDEFENFTSDIFEDFHSNIYEDSRDFDGTIMMCWQAMVPDRIKRLIYESVLKAYLPETFEVRTCQECYVSHARYSARFIPPDIWRLEVKEVRPSDAAHYDCQLSAHPPRTARVTLTVPQVSVRIVDGAGAEVSEQVCEVGSTVALRCEVNGLKMEGGPSLLWYRKEDLLNDDTTRGGISVRTEFGANGANSVLRVARVRSDDAGRYTCAVARAPPPAPAPAHVILHIIKGESLAELHQGGCLSRNEAWMSLALCVLLQVFY